MFSRLSLSREPDGRLVILLRGSGRYVLLRSINGHDATCRYRCCVQACRCCWPGCRLHFALLSFVAGDYLVVKSLAADGPAQVSGKMAPGDHIMAIGEPGRLQDIKGLDVKGVAKLMLGPPGSRIDVKVKRNEEEPFLVNLKRGWNTALASSSSYFPAVPPSQQLVTAQESPRGKPQSGRRN